MARQAARKLASPEADDADVYEIGTPERAADDSEKPKGDLVYNEDEPNLVPIFKKHPDGLKALEEIGMQAVADFDESWEDSEEYRHRIGDDWKIILGDLPAK